MRGLVVARGVALIVLATEATFGLSPLSAAPVGIFDDHQDVGKVRHGGSAAFDSAQRTYTIKGSGENIWSTHDDFQFVWKKVDGDLALSAEVSFEGPGAAAHRKACLMIRQGLEDDSSYVDVAIHGDGLTALQFRGARGALTHEIRSSVSAPRRVRLVKRGAYVRMDLATEGKDWEFSGAAVRISFREPFYVGLAVCSHQVDVTDTATFKNVELAPTLPARSERPVVYSSLETLALASGNRRIVHVTPTRIEAPNWLGDGRTLIFNSSGRLYRIPADGGTPQVIDTDFAARCNNDHGLSPDGTMLAISDSSRELHQSMIYTLPVQGGSPRPVTRLGPSYWHGWSPDGKTLAFCGQRQGEFDIYTISVAGGEETRLTNAPGLDDGPDYSPDGHFLYFNSVRTGTMQIWRMKPDGRDQEQITRDEFNNWFPHPSPDGRSVVFLSYEKGVTGHPANKDVMLRRLALDTMKIDVLGRFFGGQGTINVPCWSPDSRQIAFVSYQVIP